MRTISLSTINALTHPERIRRSNPLKHSVITTRLLSAIFALFVFLFFFSAVSVAGLGNGTDGELVVSSLNTIVNTYAYIASTSALAGSSSFDVNNADGFSVGDEILIIQTQHSSNAGVYEEGTINQINGNTISLENNLTNTFYSGTFDSTSASNTQIIRVPQYTDVDINSGASITASAWNGYSGGIVAFRATGTVTVNGSINTAGKGFRGGYCVAGATGNISYSGECYLGLGRNAHAVNEGGGSGAQRLIGATGGGGGGGGYGTAGTNGEYWGNSAMLGLGGGTYGVPRLSNMYLGAGGGGGIYTAGEGDGGPGGGVILIFANSIVNNNSISSNGGAGENSPNGGSGGGGSGGSVLLSAENIIAGTNTITSTGGAKGTSNDADGGIGGDGRIRLDYKFINDKPYQDTSEESSACNPDPGYTQEFELEQTGFFELAIDHTKIDENLTDFPMMIHLSTSSGINSFDATELFSELATYEDRKKITVYDQNNNPCYTEIEHWDSANKKAWLWVKVPQVSATEDTVLKIYYDKNSPDNQVYVGEAPDAVNYQMVVDIGSEGTYDTKHAYDPSVIKDGDTYKMWYSGDDVSNGRILYATSSDGITWSTHQMVLDIGTEGTYDTENVVAPCVIKDGDTYKMWYSGHNGSGWRIFYATSSDGITWSNHQMVLDIGSEGTYDTVIVYRPCVIKADDTYKMWYSGHNGSSGRILYATSPDGITWSGHQMVLDIGSEGTYDTVHAYTPCVIKENDTYKMWRTGKDGSNWRILYATSADGIAWTNHQMVVDKGSDGIYDTVHSYAPFIIKDGDTYKMWYRGYDGTNWRILYAQSYTPTWKTPSQNVWDDHFKLVSHLGSNLLDSTRNTNNGVNSGSDVVGGISSTARSFADTADKITFSTNGYGNSITYTVETFIKPSAETGVHLWETNNSNSAPSIEGASNNLNYWVGNTSNISTNILDVINWHYLAAVYDKTLNRQSLHMNEFEKGYNIYDASDTFGSAFYLGNRGYGFQENERNYGGSIDELRISNMPRSDAWIKATYYSNFDDLISYSSNIDTTAPPEVDTLTVTDTGSGTSVTLGWSGYDESAAGDIAHYRIYVETSEFSDVSVLTEVGTVNAGQFTYTAGGLDRDQTYYFAVVAVDYTGNAISAVTTPPDTATPTDTEPPEEVTNLQVACAENSLTFTWDHSADTAADLAGYKVYFNGDTEGVSLDASQNSYVATELSPATNYDFKVTVFDGSTNESAGVTTPGVTLLDNPTNLAPTPWYNQVNFVWNSVAPADLIQTYAVYMSQTPFTSVESMTPTLTTAGTSAGVDSLTGDTTYYFAVTTINISNGEQKNVTTVSAVPLSATYVSGNIRQNTTWALAGSPYIVTGDINIYHSTPDQTAILTIEPGVEVRFMPGTSLRVYGERYDYKNYWGALDARGTEAEPIVFTSHAASPAPGDWKGIYFDNYTNDSLSFLEHCVVEYAGNSNNANVYLASAKPTIQYNTIRNSSHSGIYVNGTGSNGAAINCNNLKDNLYGVYVTGNAQPQVSGNNFLRSQNYGLYNAGSTEVNAENNWWGDISGPDYNGDTVYGNVDVDPWLTAESDCISAPPTNTPPFIPKNPSPADGAVRIPVIQDSVPLDVTLDWAGGDPNPWDTVVYDVYYGESANSLVKIADSISATSYIKSGLTEGITYYWQIISRDNAGGQTDGPVWQFTTLGAPPDLAVSAITWDPADNLAAGQTITFTASIQNSGTGPVVDAFQVDFKIDNNSIGSESVSSVIATGGTVQVTKTWTAGIGDHTIEVVADSSGSVTESFEANNSLSENLPTIIDPTPPDMTGTSPVNGAALQQVNQIVITLFDQYGTVNDAAVIAGIEVRNGSNQLVDGTVSEAGDVFTFTPVTQPLPDDIYSVTLAAVDMAGNTQNYNFIFTVDGQAPAQPSITGGSIYSGVIQARPYADNRSNSSSVTLTGTRENNTSVWINNVQRIASGTGDWSMELSLSQGANALEVWLKDAANNQGDSEWVDIFVDSTVPAVTSVTPADNSLLGTAPLTVVIDFQETGSGLNLDNSLKSVKDSSQNPVDGGWTVSGGNQLLFTPAAALIDSLYTINIQLKDNLDNQGAAVEYHFTVDTTAPAPPVINPVTSPTYNPTQGISGTKEAYAAVLLNGEQVVGNTADTTWQHTANLESGTNQFTFVARDQAGNQSADTVVSIIYDDIPPLPVTTLTADGQTSGTTVNLSWNGYDESAHGDIDFYRIYVETASFSNVAGLTVHATVDVGTFTYTVANLTKGTTYWFAVVAVDFTGYADPVVTSVSAAPADTIAPENVTNLNVTSYEDRLVFSWTHSANTQGDLTGYKVYFNGAAEGVLLPSTANTHEETGLNPAAAYPFRITAVDNDDNESIGVSVNGVTLLPNPTNLAATPYSGYVDLSWDAAQPSQYVQRYRIYVSTTDFASVESMTPQLTTTATTANIAGLTNNTTYYFAVTTLNISNGERKAVTTISAVPVPDIQGPEVSNLKVDDTVLVNGLTLDKFSTVTLNAADPAGVSRVEFYLNGSLIRTDFSGPYSCYLDVVSMDDGAYTLTITAYDTLGNTTTVEYTFNVALAPPAAPVITQPADGLVTNQLTVTIAGQTVKDAEVVLFNNSAETQDVTAADGSGNFSLLLTLTEGANHIQAAARNRAGTGPLSSAVLVTLDTSIPYSPTALSAQAKEGGSVKLTWQPPTETSAAGYNLYRSSSTFTVAAENLRVNTGLITTTSFTDLPPADGTWYYRITTVDSAGNESDVSAEASAEADRSAPRAVSIEYTLQGNYDPATGTMAPGMVDLVLTVNEALLSTPFLSINPEGGTPLSVELTKDTDVTYTGFFVIAETTPTGTAWAIFSARDVVGNRGTEIDAGASVKIDTAGPAVSRIDVVPPAPIKNDALDPVAVTVTIGLNEAVKSGTTPQLAYLLSKDGRETATIDAVTNIETQPGDVETWQAIFELPADAGQSEPESFKFIFEAADDLDNVSDRILADNLFQVYQGELPPLETPQNLTGEALSGGRILLAWEPVEGSIGYQLYRQAPDESELSLYMRLDIAESYIDTPAVDGLYIYAVASIRSENSQESFSSMSASVQVTSDSTAPGVPQNLDLELVANGIKLEWDAPAYTEPITYHIYRSDLAEIISVEGLPPLIIEVPQTLVIDPNPSSTEHCYAVTAVDAAGNQSAPSTSVYQNFGLLPVSSLLVVQTGESPPVISWTHPSIGSIAGYDFYLGDKETGVKLHSGHLTALSYTDIGYAEDERTYTLIAVDQNEAESLGRTIVLPVLRASLAEAGRIKRGIMNRLEYTVQNLSSALVEHIRLKVEIAGHAHTSDSFDLDSGQATTVPVIVGGYDDLADVADVTVTIEVTPHAGETIRIVRTSQIDVGDGMLVLQLLNEEFTRGATGSVRFTIENSGEADIEITCAQNSGNADSNEIIWYLLDEDENVIATKAFRQSTGAQVVTLANGNSVARIAAGDTFTSEATTIEVPASAPDNVIVKLAIANIYYHQGQTTQVKMDGLSTTYPVTLIDTSYYGEVTDITPQSSTGDQDIVITGRAVERSGNDPLAGVPLNLVITINGFERNVNVLTSDDGSFTHTFTPPAGEAGIYTVRAVHPDLTDRPVHGQFVINRVSVTPAAINLGIPFNYEKTISLNVAVSAGTEVNNLHLAYDEADQPVGVYPQGVHVTLGPPVAFVGSGQSTSLGFTLWADNSADQTGVLVFKVKSDESGQEAWGTVQVNTAFSEALPVLYFTPAQGYINTGLARDDTVTETIVLENKGLAAMNDIFLTLVDQNNDPAPDWVYLNTAADQGSLAVGESREISVSFSPTQDVAEGEYDFFLHMTSSNYQTTNFGLYVSMTQSGAGNFLFKVGDIYTGTLDENDQLIQGLAGAKVKLQNEAVLTEEYTLTTDNLGEAYFEDIPTGSYKVRITANNHQEYIGRIWIKPGVSATEEVFLGYNLVTVEWEVNEITIEDKYEIVLTAVYETDMPAAVVVAEPSSISLPPMAAGDVYNGEFTLTNYGLVRADNLNFTLPADNAYFTYELSGGLPTSLDAKQVITVPFRVTCVQSPDQSEGDGGGGGCERYADSTTITYQYTCPAGQVFEDTAFVMVIYDNGQCTVSATNADATGTGGAVSEVVWNLGGGTDSGSSVSAPAAAPSQIEGVKCFPNCDRKESFCDECQAAQKETNHNNSTETHSAVNTVMREYNRDATDLAVKVPGGRVQVKRRFYDNRWWFEHERNSLSFTSNSLGTAIESIDKGGVTYRSLSADGDVFTHDVYRIIKTDTGWRWETNSGSWKEYDENGRVTASGSRSGAQGKLLYEAGENGNLIGYADRNDNQVLWFEYNADNRISAAYDSDNRRVEYSYTGGLLTGVKDVLGHDTVFEYDGDGRITKTIDAAGREFIVTYDTYGNPASVVDSQGKGHFFEFDYNSAKKEFYARIRTSANMIKEIWYDKKGDTKRVDVNGRTIQSIAKDGRNLIITDESGHVTRKEFDEWDNLVKVIYPDETTVSYEYEHTFNRRIKEIDALGIVTQYEYDDAGNLTRKVEAAGSDQERVTEYTYDDDGDLLTTTRLADGDTQAALTTITYDALGNMTSVTDAENNTTQFTAHDIMGNVLTKVDARDKTWTYAYDDAGRLKTVTDPLNNITQLFYDEVGNKVKEIDAEGKEKLFEYDDNDNLIKTTAVIDPDHPENNLVTTFEYNTDNKLTKQIDAEGKVIRYEYDSEGRLVKTLDGNNNEIAVEYADSSGCSSCSGGGTNQPSRVVYPTFEKTFAYDERGRKTGETDVLSDTESYVTGFSYDDSGNLVSKTDKENKTTGYTYDALNRLKKVTDHLNQETVYTYDNRDNLIELKDAKTNVTRFEYDKNNRLTKEIRPMGAETTYAYDAAGNLTQKIHAKNQKTEYVYDDSGRLTDIKHFNPGDHVNPVKTVTFTYDKVGNLKSYDDGTTSAQYGYDDLYRKVSEAVNYGAFTKTNAYTYLKNSLKETFTGPDSIAYGYLYDDNNQLTGVQIPNVGFITYTTYKWNRPESITLPGGSKKDYAYDPLMRVKQITTKDPGQNVLLNYQYNYDKMDNIASKQTEHGDYTYGYDDLYRLNTTDNPDFADEAFTYDPVGNRLTAANTTGDWTYNLNNELGGYDDVAYVYDANGNMTQKTVAGVVTKFFYNLEDRLERVEDGVGTVIATYHYDPFGRRLWKEVSRVRTYFHYADEGLVAELDASGNVTKSYGYKPGSTWTTDPLFMKQGTDYYFYQNDHLGTPQKLTAINGAVVWAAKYSSFGEADIDTASSITNNLRFPGQYYDEETELHYNWHRYYDPKFGRYTRPDPIGFLGGTNLYAYCWNNPINIFDNQGLMGAFKPIKQLPGIYKNYDEAWNKYHERLVELNKMKEEAYIKYIQGKITHCAFVALIKFLDEEIKKAEAAIRALAAETGRKIHPHPFSK